MSRNEWEIGEHGNVRRVTIERGENGKHVIRIDGRVAARPLDTNEVERELRIDNAFYVVRRVGEEFALDLIAPANPAAMHAAVAAESLGAAGIGARARTVRWGTYLWVAVVAMVGLLLYRGVGPNYARQAEDRVELLLSEMALGTGPQESLAIGIWARNTRMLSTDELGWAVGVFPDFRNAKNLRRKFSDWKVLSSEMVEGAEVPTAIVSIEVEGRPLKMMVPERKPITWVD